VPFPVTLVRSPSGERDDGTVAAGIVERASPAAAASRDEFGGAQASKYS
jgi:hypothetical protein